MARTLKGILKGKLIEEKSWWWLFFRAFGSAIPIAIALLIAYSAVGNLNLSSQSDLNKKLIDARIEIRKQIELNDTLKIALLKYESNRFRMQPPVSGKVLKPGLFLHYNGFHHKYSISTFTDTLIHEKSVPVERPDTFSYNDTTYMIFTEAITDIQGVVGDTACFYLDIFNK